MFKFSRTIRSAIFSAVALGLIGTAGGVAFADGADALFVDYNCENLIEAYTESAYGPEWGFDHTVFVVAEAGESTNVTLETFDEECLVDFGALYSEGHPNADASEAFCDTPEFYEI